MPALTERVLPNEQVVDTRLDDSEVALLNLDSKKYFSLNATGARIWAGIKSGRTLAEIAHALQDEYGIASQQAERSVAALVAELLREGLVSRGSKPD